MQLVASRNMQAPSMGTAFRLASSRRFLAVPFTSSMRRCSCSSLQREQQQGSASTQLAMAAGLLLPAALAAAPAAQAAEQAQAAAQAVPAELLFELADLDSKTAGALSAVLKPALTLASMLMIVRIVMSWYPEIDGKQMPWSIAYTPTEPLLSATRKVVKPFNGLDVSPIVWVALLSFVSEILTGPQGILSLIERKGI